MTTRRKVQFALFAVLALFLAFAFADVAGLRISPTGVRSPTGYVAIAHGDHAHYVPNDWSGEPGLDAFPMQPPRPGEQLLSDGRVVPIGGGAPAP